MSFDLSPVETRILGCLLEKERVTPENYPLSLNGLVAACNQTTNRDPITSFDERLVEAGLDSLRSKKLATVIYASGARVPKYRHNLDGHFDLDSREIALLCVLMVRGPQTPGELRGRADRMFHFSSLEEVETCIAGLSTGEDPLVRVLPARPGQKERRYIQLLSPEPDLRKEDQPAAGSSEFLRKGEAPQDESCAASLKSEIEALRRDLQELRDEFAAFRKQFE